jgi:hypothetical protein
MLRVLGAYFMLGAILVFGSYAQVATKMSYNWTTAALMALLLVMGATTAIAGVLLWTKKSLGLRLGVIAATFQLFAFSVTSFSYQFVPVYAIQAKVEGVGLGITAFTGPKIGLSYGSGFPEFVAIDIVSIYALVLLLRGLRFATRVS